jgi:putative phosphoribosyl transferase
MFKNREEAGKELAEKLLQYERKSPLVVALPRGGVVVGYHIAQALKAPLEVVIVRKIGAPQNPELGVGAIAEDKVKYIDTAILDRHQISLNDLQFTEEQEKQELARRKQLYRKGRNLPLFTNKTIILVDDGLATGVSARAALLALKKHHPKQIIFAVPVCSSETAFIIRTLINGVICLQSPEYLETIGQFYEDFNQVTDEEVLRLLGKANETHHVVQWGDKDFSHKIIW